MDRNVFRPDGVKRDERVSPQLPTIRVGLKAAESAAEEQPELRKVEESSWRQLLGLVQKAPEGKMSIGIF